MLAVLAYKHPSHAAGIMPIMTYGGFQRMTGFCKTYVPPEISQALEGIKDNDEAIKNFGIDLGTRMCKRLLDAGTPGVHMYTLNLERSAVSILENLGLIEKGRVRAPGALRRPFPACTLMLHLGCSSPP